ncbi:hypothetical protein JW848_07315, partial [Candidatus Bipolaricaulota bacterium]|nr:hypothetical protein [Candidatus Bipolaricaulota bacterium]
YVVVAAPRIVPAATSVAITLVSEQESANDSPGYALVQIANLAIDAELVVSATSERGASFFAVADVASGETRWMRSATPVALVVDPTEFEVWRFPPPESNGAAVVQAQAQASVTQWTWQVQLVDPLITDGPIAADTEQAARLSTPPSFGAVAAAIALFAATIALAVWTLTKAP